MRFCRRIRFALRVAALASFVFTVGCDREEKPSAPAQPAQKAPSRLDDPAYRAKLKEHIADQNKVAKDIAAIDRRMEYQRGRARAALPKGATDEQVRSELDSNPGKYPEWKFLVERRAFAEEEMKRRRDEARASIVARIEQERRESRPAGK